MKPIRHAMGCLLVGLMLAGTPAPARAADITQWLGFDLTDLTPAGSGVTGSLLFNQFDPSLGTLQNVFVGLFSFETTLITYDAQAGQTIKYQVTADTRLVLVPPPTDLDSRVLASPGSIPCPELPETGCPDAVVGLPFVPYFWADSLLPGNPLFPFFVGTGTVQIDTVLDGGGSASLSPGDLSVLVDNWANWLGTVTVTYTFEPARGVPGPASLVVLLTGLLVPLALRTRRRRAP